MANSDISGQITDGSGNPIGSAEVYLWREDLAGAGGVVASTTADSNGNFAFTAHPDGSGSSESWHVAAKDPNASVQLQSAYGVTASPPTSVDSQFDVSITGTSPSPVGPGETLTVDASLSNSGTDSDTQTITLDIDNGVGQVDSSLEAAQGGASKTVPLSWSVPSGQTKQNYTATVASADDSAGQTVTVGSGIPSSVVHRWKFDEGSGSVAADTVGSANGTIVSPTWVSGSYIDGYALEAEYVDVGPLGSYGSGLASGFTWAFTVQTSDTGKMMGARLDGEPIFSGFTNNWDPDNDTGRVQFSARATNGVSTIQTNNNYNDGNKHRVVITTDGTDPNNLEIYVDNTLDVYTPRDEGDFDFRDFTTDMHFFESTDNNTEPLNAVLDDIQFADSKWDSNEIENDYNRQPWS